MKQIEEAANGDPAAIKVLTGIVNKLKSTLETPRSAGKSHEKLSLEEKAEKTLRDTDAYRVPVAIDARLQMTVPSFA